MLCKDTQGPSSRISCSSARSSRSSPSCAPLTTKAACNRVPLQKPDASLRVAGLPLCPQEQQHWQQQVGRCTEEADAFAAARFGTTPSRCQTCVKSWKQLWPAKTTQRLLASGTPCSECCSAQLAQRQAAYTATLHTCTKTPLLTCALLWHRQRQTDAKLGIEDANLRFYDAFRSGSLQVREPAAAMARHATCGDSGNGSSCASAASPLRATRAPCLVCLRCCCRHHLHRPWTLCGVKATRCRSSTQQLHASLAGRW